jgi:YHS domain-containing protein
MNRRQFLNLGSAAALAVTTVSLAGPAALAAGDEVFTGLVKGVAVGGYDPVAYFTENKPVEGSDEFTTDYKGATWRFSTAANRNAFVADPERYAPQYGGYCAYAVSSGYTAKGDPQAWRIVDGKLYLNYNKSVQQRWAQDIPGHISRADANWPSVLN